MNFHHLSSNLGNYDQLHLPLLSSSLDSSAVPKTDPISVSGIGCGMPTAFVTAALRSNPQHPQHIKSHKNLQSANTTGYVMLCSCFKWGLLSCHFMLHPFSLLQDIR